MAKNHVSFSPILEHPDVEQAMLLHQIALGGDLLPYKHHAYRVLNYAAWQVGYFEEQVRKIAIAAAFHDIGIWTHNTFDYLVPSEQCAMQYIERYHLPEPWCIEIGLMIERHHQMRQYKGIHKTTVEAMRKADLVDISKGLIRGKMPFAVVEQCVGHFPYLGFHGRLAIFALRQFLANPLRPLPMLRWRK